MTARFSNGEDVGADVLTSAEGRHSAVREQLFGDGAPQYSDDTAWRAVVGFQLPGLTGGESWGRGQRFGIVPMVSLVCYEALLNQEQALFA